MSLNTTSATRPHAKNRKLGKIMEARQGVAHLRVYMYAVLHHIFLVLSCYFSISLSPPLPHGRVAVCTVVLIDTLFARVCLPLSYATHTYTHTDTRTHTPMVRSTLFSFFWRASKNAFRSQLRVKRTRTYKVSID